MIGAVTFNLNFLFSSRVASATAVARSAVPGQEQENGQAKAVDSVDLSGYAVPPLAAASPAAGSGAGGRRDDESGDASLDGDGAQGNAAASEEKGGDGDGSLTDEELLQVKDLASRDREVRAHEQAHKAVGGQYAGGISYEFQVGPDNIRYAVGGEVSIDVSPAGDPEATVAKMRQVKAAALAPAEPSAQDRSVAARAAQLESQVFLELRQLWMAAAGSAMDGADNEARPGTLVDVTA